MTRPDAIVSSALATAIINVLLALVLIVTLTSEAIGSRSCCRI